MRIDLLEIGVGCSVEELPAEVAELFTEDMQERIEYGLKKGWDEEYDYPPLMFAKYPEEALMVLIPSFLFDGGMEVYTSCPTYVNAKEMFCVTFFSCDATLYAKDNMAKKSYLICEYGESQTKYLVVEF